MTVVHQTAATPTIVLLTILSCLIIPGHTRSRTYAIQRTWDGQCVCHDPVKITLDEVKQGFITVKVEAPFFNSPAKPDGPPGQSFPQLWDYEVAEVFFLNDMDQYLEVELSPHGQFLLLFLNGRRNAVDSGMPIDYTATIKGDHWIGEANITLDYLPPNVNKFNAFAIHGEGEGREYQALYPVTDLKEGMVPDFHRLELFQPLDMSAISQTYNPSRLSPQWAQFLN